MVSAKITKREGYRCAPNGSVVQVFAFGAMVNGKVAEWALRDHAAQRMFDPREEVKIVTAPEVKRKPGRPRKEAPE